MSAMSLPLELQQQIFSFLDTKSFYSARQACRWWRFASNNTVTLSRHLKKLPILPQVDPRTSTPLELQGLFNEAAYSLLVGLDVQRKHDLPGNVSDVLPAQRICATSNGDRQVTLNNRIISLYDTSSKPRRLLTKRPQNDLKETVGGGPWLRVNSKAHHQLALSSDGNMLAVAQERTIQIYNLTDEPDSFTVNQYISSAAGHYICGLAFEQGDHVLRVRLSGKGTVLYLGTPPTAAKSMGKKANIEFWKSKAGLRHSFLDTSRITLASSDDDYTARLSGLQLLRPLRDGWLFAAQCHGGSQCSRYVIGHIRASVPDNTSESTAESDGVTILADLHSYLSAWHYSLNTHAETGLGMWENMPSAHEHHPVFAMNEDSNLLALGETDKKCVRPKPLTSLFLYRLPTLKSMEAMLSQRSRQSGAKWASLSSFLDRLETQQRDEDTVMEDTSPEPKYEIGRLPICLSTIRGDLTDLAFTTGSGVELIAKTGDCTRIWRMSEV
ncbi:hypothetical protein K431DRAFT_221200 [Polychaeton citri CBS 116435]|uniref:F-box domain-containing protein n=1 Tax=Polychaeton citri CBS 116435 TaxID=1314669 RepID=A0A9P4URQ1_9PEZI|nr:hypothetical protein K431DRAFT_221200 [Polychaeton citri CBS 116435]